MSRYRKKPAMLAGILLVTLVFTSQLYSSNLFNDVPGSRDTPDGYVPGDISSSASNEVVQLAGTDRVVRYIARNSSAVTVGNTTASSNLTLPATTAPATVLDATNTSLNLGWTASSKNHTIENDAAFDIPLASSGNASHPWANTSRTYMPTALKTGNGPNYQNLNYGSMGQAWIITSVNVSTTPTVRVNLTYPYLTNIQYRESLRLDLWLRMAFNRTVKMNVFVYDHHNNQGWVNATPHNEFFYTGDIVDPPVPPQYYETIKDLRSQSLRNDGIYRSLNISLVFTSGGNFKASLYTAKVKAYKANEHAIHADNWVALSFDLRGNAWVHGFSMHLRSFAITSTETLSMRVFKTNNTAITLAQIADQTSTIKHQPDLAQVVSGTSRTFNYTGDGIAWFNFTAPVYMTTGNYFVVLNSSVSGGTRYRIVVIPFEDTVTTRDPNVRVDHSIAITTNDGSSWVPGILNINGNNRKVDASPFVVGLRRGLKPSDVAMKINGTAVSDWQMSTTLPFSASNSEWGRGTWNRVAINARTTATTFNIPITWNQTIQTAFTYTANSSMLIHAEDPGASLLKLSRALPLWSVSYQFNKTKYTGWNGFSFNLTFPSDWSILNITYPDGVDYYVVNYRRSVTGSLSMYPFNWTSINGLEPAKQELTYVSWFNSPNYTKSVDTYLRFNATTLHGTEHFVNGDNLAARVRVQTAEGKAVFNGQVNLALFYPNDDPAATAMSSTIKSTVGFVTQYNFDDASLHTFAGAAVGRHLARVYWFNGSEAGIIYKNVFKVSYTVIGYEVSERLADGLNQVSGSFLTGANESIPTNLVHVSIDKDDVVPVGINVNQLINDVMFLEFNQTETVFNPNEVINFTVKVNSTSLGLQHQVKANIQVVNAFDGNKVIMNLTSPATVLNYSGGLDSERTISLSGTFPGLGGTGINVPLRNSLFMTKVNIFIDGDIAATWMSEKTHAVKMDNATDGTVLATKIVYDYTGISFSQLFTRANETVFNEPTTFMMILESSGGVTLPAVLARDFTNSMTSSIKNLTVTPVAGDVLTIRNSMTLAGKLYYENGSLVNGTTVSVLRLTTGPAWVNYFVGTSTTNNTLPVSNGTFSGTFLIPATYNRTMTVNFTFSGNPSVAKTSACLTVNITQYTSSWSIRAANSRIVVIGGYNNNYVTFIVNNTGNTTLMFDYGVTIHDSLVRGEISTWANTGLLSITPGTWFSFSLVLTADNPGTGNKPTSLSIELSAYAIETKQTLNVTATFDATVQPPDLASQLGSIWYIGYFGAIALLAIVALVMLKRVSARSKRPVKVGTLAKGKGASKGDELPYAVKKGADIGKSDEAKKYKSIDEAMAEVKSDADKDTAKDGGSSVDGSGDASKEDEK